MKNLNDGSKKGGKFKPSDVVLWGGIFAMFVALSAVLFSVSSYHNNRMAEHSLSQLVQLTALERSLSDIAPSLSAAGITDLTVNSAFTAEIGFGSENPLPVSIVSIRESGFPVHIDVHADSLVITVMKTTPLPSSVDDAEAFIRSLAEHSIAAIQSRKQYGLQPFNK